MRTRRVSRPRWRRRAAGMMLSGALVAASAVLAAILRHASEEPPPPPPPRAMRAVPSVLHAPAPPPHDTRATLAALRARVASADPRVPAAEVDRWMLRMVGEERLRGGFEAALSRMGRYEGLIRDALRSEGLPPELLYLPLVESGFHEGAVSRAGAVGLWQFMAPTARYYGLEISEHLDERRDPVRSTTAAARHLRDLRQQFGSWHLALAAYNAGGPRVSGILRRHAEGRWGEETLYWRVRPHLPRETRTYVPLFLASAALASDPALYGLAPNPEPALTYREILVAGGVGLEAVARAHGADPDEVRRLNPHLVRGMTPPGRSWAVRLPADPPETEG
jgi:hypothetical protein